MNNIVNCINEIESYTKHLDYTGFVKEEGTKGAVSRNLQMIGDAAYMLYSSDDWKRKFEDVNLQSLISLKNAWYNDEWEVDHQMLWNIIEADLPEIKEVVSTESEKMYNNYDIGDIGHES